MANKFIPQRLGLVAKWGQVLINELEK